VVKFSGMINSSKDGKSRLQSLQVILQEKLSLYNVANQTLKNQKSVLRTSKINIKTCEESQQILQEIAQQVQQTAHKKIASVVSRCLAAVFDDPYQFKIEFEKKRGRTEARLTFVQGDEERAPLKGSGGGYADIAAFALRLACMVLSKPRRRRVLVLDEPFRHLHSAKYRERARNLLETLSHEMDVQIILVTGVDQLRMGKVVEIK
jgi:DNA repair exonuclease SbcCD ATPase subunit